MYSKKEVLVVFLVLFVILLAGSGFGLEKYEIIVKGVGQADDYFGCDGWGKVSLGLGNAYHSYSSECEDSPWINNVGDLGCVVDGWEDDEGLGAYDDCAYIQVNPGLVINQNEVPENLYKNIAGSLDAYPPMDLDAFCPLRWGNFVTQSDVSFICGQNHYWYACVPDSIGQIIWVNKIMYNCTKSSYEEGEQYTWKEVDIDYDYDGYTEGQGDCMNVPSDSEVCPLPDLIELIGLTTDEARTTIRSTYCSDLRYSTCAICINPGAPEVCGDNVNNDCGGPAQYEELNQTEGKTSDDCNKNQFACRQEAPPLDNSEDNATGLPQTNIYGETFAWINTADGGYCCGYNGIDDLGTTKVSSTGEGQFLCLNTKPELVGHDVEYTYASPFCGDEWCWVSPSTGAPAGGQFKIFTIKKPGVKPYDIASNGEGWISNLSLPESS